MVARQPTAMAEHRQPGIDKAYRTGSTDAAAYATKRVVPCVDIFSAHAMM
ncbi:hypothetical protein ACQP1G_34545 [Nocardia sp. CA-107356]